MPIRSTPGIALFILSLAPLLPTHSSLRADTALTVAPDKSGDILYEDPDARSSATITQVIPNVTSSPMTLDNIRRIRVKQGILIIEWGNTATTLLPHQFISAITINKRAPAAASQAASQPAAPR